ncbi:hypothetical protein LF1_45460 [Rubripirellula obstinata]|uniref:DUF2764 family protein n=1 Tax=Rubripirellula obstinata TaxID=406547 RepID=A0A5B1CPU0_9BACT|nr:hypothetical protein [Rubripirellula obstinata]KAA1261985.1 hypothetical protein LF1_45460 [Rubripirellula obstinata]
MTTYYTLVASLPPLPRSFDAGPIPITASTLRHRLSMLTDADRFVTDQLADFFRWDRQPIERSDGDVIARHQQLKRQIRNPLVLRLVEHRFEVRTLVAALRCQRDGAPRPELPALPVSTWIRRHWDKAGFGSSSRYPWVAVFCQALDEKQPKHAQYELFSELWQVWSRLDQQYHFTFESVVLYLARWEILFRWSSQNTELGQQRFDDLVEDILGSSVVPHRESALEFSVGDDRVASP